MRTQQSEHTVVLIEDDPAQAELFTEVLESAGFAVTPFSTRREFEHTIRGNPPGLLLVDYYLPDGDALDICTSVRAWFDGPIIVISGDTNERTIVDCLEHGADDYIVKPIRIREFAARVDASLRRAAWRAAAAAIVQAAGFTVNFSSHRITYAGETLSLPRSEATILSLAVSRHPERIVDEKLFQALWPGTVTDNSQRLRAHVSNLRRRLREWGIPIEFERDMHRGYRLRELAPDGDGQA